MIYAQPRQRRTAFLTNAPAGIAADLRFRVLDPPNTVVLAETAAGIAEGPAGTYTIDFDAPAEQGTYAAVWRRVSTGLEVTEELEVGWSTPAAIAAPAGPSYATPDALRAELEIDAAALSDAAASRLISQGEDVVDDLAGARMIDQATGRKITVADLEPWQALKVQQATLAIASVLHADPRAFEPARYGSVSGPDFSKSAPAAGGMNPAARIAARRAAAQLDAAGLRVLTARAVAGGPEPLPGTRAW